MKSIQDTPTAQIVADVFAGKQPSGDEIARFLVGLAMMEAGPDGPVTQAIITRFGAYIDSIREAKP